MWSKEAMCELQRHLMAFLATLIPLEYLYELAVDRYGSRVHGYTILPVVIEIFTRMSDIVSVGDKLGPGSSG
jgi:hypothetical protein